MSQSNQCYYKFPDGRPCPNPALPGDIYCLTHQYVGSPGTGYTGGGGPNSPDPPIVISGGSVVIEFDADIFPPVGSGKYANSNKKVRRVEIDVDGGQPVAIDVPNGRLVVRIYYGNP